MPLSLVPTSDVSGIVSEIGIARTFRSSENQNDVNDGSRSGVGRKRKPDPSDSDSVELPIPIATSFLNFHWNVRLLTLPTPIPTLIPIPITSLVGTSRYLSVSALAEASEKYADMNSLSETIGTS